jgi:DNA repair exonuclease SbcCD nuclease subunit
MADEIKFIHASDFHLDQPISGLIDLPTHLKSALVQAPYLAAQRVFDLAIAEKVDFVLLSGDLFDMETAGCRPPAFLLTQFERLRERGIEVYWCGGSVDHPDRWPATVDLPNNVRTFSTPVVEEAFHRRRERIVATIVASALDPQRKTNADFIVEASAAFPIGLSHGRFDINAPAAKSIRYWAVGGGHRPQIIDKTTHVIVTSGTPQGRSPDESGAHGCHLVRVDAGSQIRTQFVETDTIRWLPQKISIAESTDFEALQNIVSERALKLVTENPDQTLLVNWQFIPSGGFNPQLRNDESKTRLLEWLRREFGSGTSGLWTNSIEFDQPANMPEGWFEEDTILGDYLRAVGRYQEDPSINLALHEYLPRYVDNDSVGSIVRVSEDDRARILAAAALVGVDYLAVHRDWEDAQGSSKS